VLAKCGIVVPMADIFGAAGVAMLDQLQLPAPYAARIASLRRVIDGVSFESRCSPTVSPRTSPAIAATKPSWSFPGLARSSRRSSLSRSGTSPGSAPRRSLCSWAGLTPRHYESDTKSRNGRITKQGSRLLRWAAVEAIQRAPAGSPMRHQMETIIARRGNTARNIAKVAAARKLLTLIFYGLRDGEIR
jgi:hypothetical protein